MQTPGGKTLYARRKVIVEPGWGQIKEARGFRRFLRRGLATIGGAWRLVCLPHNLRKMWRYGRVLRAISAVMQTRLGA
jgi:Transposase DDE domain